MASDMCIRVVTADAQPIVRAGVKQILSSFPDLVVVGEAATSADAYALCERLRPDVLLLDPTLPGILTVITRLHENACAVRVVVLAERVDADLLSRLMPLGIAGYLVKQIAPFDFAHPHACAVAG